MGAFHIIYHMFLRSPTNDHKWLHYAKHLLPHNYIYSQRVQLSRVSVWKRQVELMESNYMQDSVGRHGEVR